MTSRNFVIKTIRLALTAAMGLSVQAYADIKIGVAGPHTGPNAAYGEQLWEGASQAAEDINAKGGLPHVSLGSADRRFHPVDLALSCPSP